MLCECSYFNKLLKYVLKECSCNIGLILQNLSSLHDYYSNVYMYTCSYYYHMVVQLPWYVRARGRTPELLREWFERAPEVVWSVLDKFEEVWQWFGSALRVLRECSGIAPGVFRECSGSDPGVIRE